MLALNTHLFLLLNAPADPSGFAVAFAEFTAAWLIVGVPALLVALWIWGAPARRAGLVSTAIAAALALGTNQLIGLLWYEPRPFMIGLGHTLVAHAPDNSFPSDHATFMLAIGLGLVATRGAPEWGKAVSVLGLLVAWARLYLGLHFPIDMLTSTLIGSLFGAVAALVRPIVARWMMPLVEWAYEGSLRLLRLPPRLFPRKF